MPSASAKRHAKVKGQRTCSSASLRLVWTEKRRTRYVARYASVDDTPLTILLHHWTDGEINHLTGCLHLPSNVGDISRRHICRRQNFLSATCQSEHAVVVCLARSGRMGVADLCNACSAWSTIGKCRPIFRKMSPTNVAGSVSAFVLEIFQSVGFKLDYTITSVAIRNGLKLLITKMWSR